MARRWEEHLPSGAEAYWCQPSDANARGAKDFLLSGCDQVMPKVHARMSMHYPLPESTGQSRRDIVQLLKTGLEKLASQVPCLTATIAFDAASKRGTMKTIGDNDGVLLVVTGADAVRTDLPSYAELERERFAPWKLPKGKAFPEALINPIAAGKSHDGGLPACIFQLSFIEGGVILTAAFHHYLVDGPSVDLLFRAWAAHCQGKDEIPLYTDRFLLSSPKRPDACEFQRLEQAMTARGCMVNSTKPDPANPWSNLMAQPTKSAVISFSREATVALKAEIAAQRPSTPVSTADCVHAICWTGLTRAKAALAEGEHEMDSWTVFPVTFRTRSFPEFPRNFIGNTTFMSGAVLPVGRLKASEGPIEAAVALRNIIDSVDATFLEDGLAWVDSIDDFSTRSWLSSPPRKIDSGFTSWACLKYQNWDFGFGSPAALRPPASPIPYVFPLSGKTDAHGREVIEVVIAATEETHRLLMQDVELQRYTTDYHLEP